MSQARVNRVEVAAVTTMPGAISAHRRFGAEYLRVV
jgi:hypothetical protein